MACFGTRAICLPAVAALVLAGCAGHLTAPGFPKPFTAEFEDAVTADVDAIVAGMEAYAREVPRGGGRLPPPLYAGGQDRA